VTALLTGKPFLWELSYFKSPGPRFYQVIIALLLAFPAILGLYQLLRRRAWWRYELAAVTAFPLAAALFYQPRAALVALWVLVACYAAGRFVLRKLRIGIDHVLDEIALAAGIGLAVLLIALFVLGLCKGFHGWSFALLLGVPIIFFWRDVASLGPALLRYQTAWVDTSEFSTALGALFFVFTAACVLYATMVVLSPSLTYDVLTSHLPAAQYYRTVHALQPVPNGDYSYFPQSIESLMALGLTFAGQPAAQMLPPLFFALSLMLAFRIARHCGADRLSALGAVVLAATLPALHWTGSVAKNDFAVVFFVLASLDCYLRWQQSGTFRWLQLGVFFVAAANGIKDTAAVALPAAALLYGYAAWRQPRRLRAFASLSAIFLACGLHWQIRDYLLTGNPIYPLISHQTLIPWENTPAILFSRYLMLPWDLQFHANWFFEGPVQFPLGVVLLMFAPVWLLLRTRRLNRSEAACLVFALVYLVCWAFFPFRSLRYAAPPVLLLVVLTGCRALALRPKTIAARLPLLTGLAYCLVFAICGTAIIEINGPLLRFFARRIDSREYLREAYYPYLPLEAVRARWRPGDWTYSAGNCAVAYGPDPARFVCFVPSDNRYNAQAVKNEIAQHPYRFVLLPAGSLEASVMGPNVTPFYRDAHFAVYER